MRLRIYQVGMSFVAPDGGTLDALGPVSATIDAGQFVALLGPSGCGKSTLVQVIAGLQIPTYGQVWLDDKPVKRPSRRIGVMFQDANLMPWRTVEQNVGLPLEIAGVSPVVRKRNVLSLLEPLGLGDFAEAFPSELSGGMAQRVALGRVLIQQPDVLLLDEPFGALDALTREKISLDLLTVWAQHRQTVLMVTHDVNEAVLLADRVLVMSRRPGRFVADIQVELPRPRNVELIYTTEFMQTARVVRSAIDRS